MARRGSELRITRGQNAERAATHNPNPFGPAEDVYVPNKAEPEILDFEKEIEQKKQEGSESALLKEVVERACSLTGADGAVIGLVDQSGVVCRASTGTGPVIGSRLQPDSGLTKECFVSGQVVVCEDVEHDSRVHPSIAKSLQLRSAVAVPIMAKGSVLGVVEVLSSRPSAFDSTHVARLLRIALLLAPILAPEPGQSEKRAEEKRRAWLLAAGAALFLLMLLFLFAKLNHRPPQTSSAPVAPPASDASKRDEAITRPTETARKELGAQGGKRSERSSRGEVNPTTASLPNAKGEESGAGGQSEQSKTPTSLLAHPADTGPVAAEPGSKLPGAEGRDIEATTRLEPFELPILTEPGKAPILAFTPAIPPPLRSTSVSLPDFVLERTLKAHSSWVTAVAFSADGQRLASGSWDQTVKFWDVPTGHQLSTATKKMKEVQALAFSGDGQWLAAENSSNTVTLWDATTGQEIRTLAGDKPLGVWGSNWVYSIAFSPDGRWLASGLDDKTVRLWDVRTGRAVRDLAALRRSVIYAAFSPDGRWLASGDGDKSIRVWDVSTGQEIRRLSGHKKAIYAVAFSPNGRWLASASADKSIKLWDVATGREVHTLTGHGNLVTSLAFSPDGRWLASGSWDKTVKIWAVATGRQVQTLAGHDHSIYTVAFDSRGRWLASGSEDGTIKLWRLSEGVDRSGLR